jgi:hypothetical protein
MNRRQSSGKLAVTLLISVVLLALAFAAVLNRMVIRDWVTVNQFQPSSEVAELAVQSGMNDAGKYLFYSGQPTLKNAEGFNDSCGEHERSTSVLGCYVNYQIYLFDIENKELDGIEEVTAAHEMLHAAYDRLGASDKGAVERMIKDMLPDLEADEAFNERMAAYGELDEADRINELHSIIATEVVDLPDDLEEYYERYFSDREKVAGLYAKYSGVFAALHQRADLLSNRYNQIVELRNQLVEASNREYQQLTADIQTFEIGPKTNSDEARELNRRAAEYNARLDDVKRQLTLYDEQLASIKAELDTIAIHSKKLNDSINSQVKDPAESVS